MANTNKFIRLGVIIMFGVFFLALFPIYLGLSRSGFTEQDILTQFFFYVGPGIGYLMGMAAAVMVSLLITKGDSIHGDSLYFLSPGEGVSPKFMKGFTLPQHFLGWLIVFSIIGLLTVVATQTTFTGVGSLEQQFSVFDNLLFSNSLVPMSENLGAAFFGGVVISLLMLLSRKMNWDKGLFIGISSFAYILAFVFYAVGLHILRYGTSESNLIIVGFFWAFGGIITLLTGNFMPFLAMHIANNLFVGLRTYFTSEQAIFYSIVVIAILAVIYGVAYRDRLFGGSVYE